MPTQWTGTVTERYARLEKENRRCDGNNRRCTNGAIEEYALLPAHDWEPIPGAEMINKRACSRHARQFTNYHEYVVVMRRRFPKMHNGHAA